MTQQLTHPKTIKSTRTKYFYIELLEMPNSKYCVNYESHGESYASVDISDLDLALDMYDDIFVMIEGN